MKFLSADEQSKPLRVLLAGSAFSVLQRKKYVILALLQPAFRILREDLPDIAASAMLFNF